MPAAGFVPQVMAQSVPLAMDDDAAARMGLPQPEAAQASEDRSPHGTLKLYAPLKRALNLLLVLRMADAAKRVRSRGRSRFPAVAAGASLAP